MFVNQLLYLDLGELYAWGSNSFGQLGLPQVQQKVGIPKKISQEVVCVHMRMYVFVCTLYSTH